MFIDSEGHAWACGQGGNGELGNNQYSNQTTPVQVLIQNQGARKVIFAACCTSRSAVVLDDGSIYGFGYNNVGVLGSRNYNGNVADPQQIDHFNDIKVSEVHFGYSHAVFLDREGSIYTLGDNNYGQCGTGGRGTVRT